ESIASMIGDGGNFMRMEPQIQSMQNAASAWNAEKGFQMAGVIPHHGGRAATRPESEFCQCRREPARAAIKFSITAARDGLVRLARNNLDARKDFPGTLQNRRERQRKIHHRAAHRASRMKMKLR